MDLIEDYNLYEHFTVLLLYITCTMRPKEQILKKIETYSGNLYLKCISNSFEYN
jgi:hypothetical protein